MPRDLMKEETEYPVSDDFFDHFQWVGGEMGMKLKKWHSLPA